MFLLSLTIINFYYKKNIIMDLISPLPPPHLNTPKQHQKKKKDKKYGDYWNKEGESLLQDDKVRKW